MNKILLTEGFAFGAARIFDPANLTESDHKVMQKYGGKSSNPILVGVCQMADEKNGNGRIYPKDILNREVQKYLEIIKNGRATGELDHPEQSEVSLERISHRIMDMWWEDNKVMCKTMILDNPKLPAGQLAAGLVEEGIVLGISSRGLGSVREDYQNGGSVVEEDFSLICFDLVSEPSTPGAFQYPQNRSTHKRMQATDFSKRLNPQEEQELQRYLNKESKINSILDEILKG
jgi:hypothetical protein